MLSDVMLRMSGEAGLISPERMAATLHVPVSRIAEMARVHRNTLSRGSAGPLAQERLGVLASIIADATDIIGDSGRATLWLMRQPIPGFAGRTAAELLADGHVEAVRAHLNQYRDGGYA